MIFKSLYKPIKRQIQFEHENHQDKENARWNRIGTPSEEMDSSREQVTTWMSKITSLRGGEYTELDEKDLTFQFSLQVQVGDQEETLKVYTLKDDWYANSTFSEGYMKLVTRSIEGLYSDIPSISNLK